MDSPNFAQSLDNDDGRIGHMFVVGGFAESAILQESLRSEFGYKMNVIIPQVRTRFLWKLAEISIETNFLKMDIIVNLLGMFEKQISHDFYYQKLVSMVKLIYSEKAIKFFEISTVDLTVTT